MLKPLRKLLKKLLPQNLLQKIRPLGHGLESLIYHYALGRPSDKMIIIGVTGTKGKTSTAHITYQLLNNLNKSPLPNPPHQGEGIGKIPTQHICGLVSTAVIDSGKGEELNKFRMTQLSGATTHKLLAQMVKAGYKYAVIEVSSEGLAQNRHLGINFDIAIFTNLTPDHIEAHGSFENYKKAKGKLFTILNRLSLTTSKKKINPNIKKTIIANADDENSSYYLSFPAEQKITYGTKDADLTGSIITDSPICTIFRINNLEAHTDLPGKFNLYNVLAATGVAKSLGFDDKKIEDALEELHAIPGRMETLQWDPFIVLIDYAHEKASMVALYTTIKDWINEDNKIIHVFGATGGVRDKSRRTDLGKIVGQFADILIITDEDPFDEEPWRIIEDIAKSALPYGKETHRMPDRRLAIAKALSLAKKGDLVLITGKGAEQKIARANGTYEDWDDRIVTREELAKLKTNT